MDHADAPSPPSWATTFVCRTVDGVRGVYTYLVEPRAVPEVDTTKSPKQKDNNPFLSVFAVCGIIFVLAVCAITWHDRAEQRRARRRAATGGGGDELPLDEDNGDGSWSSRRAARRLRRARLRASLGAAVGRVGQRLQQLRQTYGEKYRPVAGNNRAGGGNGAALLPVYNAPAAPSSSTTARESPRRSSVSRYSMEEEIAQFRAAADMVDQMVSAEEGRSKPSASGPRAEGARAYRPPPPPPPRSQTAAYRHLEDDDEDAAPPAYTPY